MRSHLVDLIMNLGSPGGIFLVRVRRIAGSQSCY